MNRQATSSKETGISKALLAWYRTNRRRLPWREKPEPYRVWVSEIMLQQTRVETVIPYFERFLERFPTVETLAAASEEEVLTLWSGLGYYRRARSLLKGAKTVLESHGGAFPRSYEAALEIPGIGPYTAAAILSIAYGEPYPVLDGNVERVLARILRLEENPRQAAVKKRLRDIAGSWMPHDQASSFNQAMMELGALVCTPVSPDCPRCPVSKACQGAEHGDAEKFPRLPKKRKTIAVELEAGILRRGDRFLLERIEGFDYLEGLWLFPLAAPGEGGIAARLAEVLGTKVEKTGQLKTLRHSITFRRLVLQPQLLKSGRFSLKGKPAFRWAWLEELGSVLPVSSLCLKIANRLLEEA
ncbi:MAG: A/G-specific adenine glycosylase [Planctomycetota bacterium]|nr:A/G-specific adenine glycosylase [Planctomycetota bacterium]